ncbi:MAG: fasciclin domain-containing protein [Bacteroidota bacterium]
MNTLLSIITQKTITRVSTLILIFTVGISLISCDDDSGSSNNDLDSIVEIVQTNDDFTILYSALTDANLVTTLEGEGPFTVFAPSDAAFEALPEGLLESLTTDQLAEILSYHVVEANIPSSSLSAEQTVNAVDGGQLFVTADGSVVVNDAATVTQADLEASNGVIHAIDQVLLPDAYQDLVGLVTKRYALQSLEDAVVSADLVATLQTDTQDGYTIFAPTNDAFDEVDLSGLTQEELADILTYHVLPSAVLSGDLQSTQVVETVQGESLLIEVANSTVSITDNSGQTYEVVEADLQGTNGVMHIIDGVLNPAPNIIDVATENGSFSTLLAALDDADLTSVLEGAGPYTVFAPTDDAFAALPAGTISGLTLEQLTEVLSYHVVSGSVMSTDLSSEQAVEALDGGELFITVDGQVSINDIATVTTADVEASNGVIHVVDAVLLPDNLLDVVGVVSKRYTLSTLESAVIDADLVSTLQTDTNDGYTVFAPTNAAFDALGVDLGSLTQQELQDILTYHVLPSAVLSGDISAGTVTTVNGADLTIAVDNDGNVSLTDQAGNTYSVTEVDLEGTNGVVHVIDGVLLPSS